MEAMDFARWTRNVDKSKLGGHYSYVVGSLSADMAEDNPERRVHDEQLAETLQTTKTGTQVPRSTTPQPMKAAFTDRSCRMREGHGTRQAMVMEHLHTSVGDDHGCCSCAVCKPQRAKPAGQPSRLIHSNRESRCTSIGVLSPKPGGREVRDKFDSKALAEAVDHSQCHERSTSLPPKEEIDFHQNMGRKVRHPTPVSPGTGRMMTHRTMQEDRERSAGDCKIDMSENSETRFKGRQVWQGNVGDRPSRSGIALVISPSAQDPPVPTQITTTKKAEGNFKGGLSAEASKHIQHFNQDLFRFEGPQGTRSMSVPPDFRGCAGVPLKNVATPRQRDFGGANPVTLHGHETDATKWSLSDSSRRSFHGPHNNRSYAMSAVTDHHAFDRQAVMEATLRRQTDKAFSELCDHTDRTNLDTSLSARHFKTNCGHKTSPRILSALAWNE